jgi:ElaA protein
MPHRVASFAELDAPTLYALLALRCGVFVVEQRCPYQDLDGRHTERATRHLWWERGGVPGANLRLLTDPDGAARPGRAERAVVAGHPNG